MQANEIYLSLYVDHFEGITHDEITRILGVTPTREIIKDTPRHPAKKEILWPMNRWVWEATDDKHMPLEDQMNILLDTIQSNIEAFKTIGSKHDIVFASAIYIYNDKESTPPVGLTKQQVKILNELNAEFNVDLYNMTGLYRDYGKN